VAEVGEVAVVRGVGEDEVVGEGLTTPCAPGAASLHSPPSAAPLSAVQAATFMGLRPCGRPASLRRRLEMSDNQARPSLGRRPARRPRGPGTQRAVEGLAHLTSHPAVHNVWHLHLCVCASLFTCADRPY